jgi:hypothetical protein
LNNKETKQQRFEEAECPQSAATAFWTAPAERSGDGAFDRAKHQLIKESHRAHESGVSRWLSGFPPQSKMASPPTIVSLCFLVPWLFNFKA